MLSTVAQSDSQTTCGVCQASPLGAPMPDDQSGRHPALGPAAALIGSGRNC